MTILGFWTGLLSFLNLPAQEIRTTDNFQPIILPYSEEARTLTIDLADYFTIEGLGDGTLVRFISNLGVFHIELLDEDAPITTENFLNYVESDRYVNSIIHRSVNDFVIQGGGFTLEAGESAPQQIPTDDPIVNEFNSKNSNLRGTLSMAKIGGDPDSATSQFFVNLSDNSQNLDNQNGGFTVFAEVVGQGMNTVDAIAALPVGDANSLFGSAFGSLPLVDFDSEVGLTLDNFIRFLEVNVVEKFDTGETIGVIQIALDSLSEESFAEASLDGTILTVELPAQTFGSTDINFVAFEAGLDSFNLITPSLSLSVGSLIPDFENAEGWNYSDWFGFYYEPEESPWIYHRRLGWLYRSSEDLDGGIVLYTPLGWLWTREDVAPYFWKFPTEGESGNWLYWRRNSSDPVLFYDFAADNGAGSFVPFE